MLTVGVVVPTRDRPWNLRRCLQALARTDLELLSEVVVVDDAGGTEVGAAQLERVLGRPVVVVRNDRRCGAAASRNRGAAIVTGTCVGFVDDDSEVLPDWTSRAAAAMADGRAAVTGRVERIADDVLTRARQARYERRYQDIGDGDSVPFLAGGNAVVRADVFADVGGFPDVRSMSDSGIVRRIEESGGACHFDPRLRVEHWHNHGWRVAVREAFLAGRATPGPIGPPDALRSLRAAVVDPHADTDAALVNAGLQAVFLSGHVTGRVGRGGSKAAAGGDTARGGHR